MSEKKFKDFRRGVRKLFVLKRPRCTFRKSYRAAKKDWSKNLYTFRKFSIGY